MDKEQLKLVLEALIFASESPLSLKQIQAILPEESPDVIQQALNGLSTDLQGRSFYLKKVAGGYQFATKADYATWIGHMFKEKARSKMSRAALETLAIVAFKQPISRVEVSAIRGVNSDSVMKTLLDARLITIAGRDSGPGRPLLFKTTSEFLQYFGIDDISELPRPKEVEELLAEGEADLIKELPDELLFDQSAGTEEEPDKKSSETPESTVENTDDSAVNSSKEKNENENK